MSMLNLYCQPLISVISHKTVLAGPLNGKLLAVSKNTVEQSRTNTCRLSNQNKLSWKTVKSYKNLTAESDGRFFPMEFPLCATSSTIYVVISSIIKIKMCIKVALTRSLCNQ